MYKQLCVIHGLILGKENIPVFEKAILDKTGCRVRFLCELKTNPDRDRNNKIMPDTGGRNDVLFYIHDDDIGKFAAPRLSMGIRWWEDVIKYNEGSYLYPEEFIKEHPATW